MASRAARLVPLLASLWAANGFAQTAPTASGLTAEENSAVERSIAADSRVREMIGPGQPRVTVTLMEPDKAEAEAHLDNRSTTPPSRRAAVVLFNPQSNRAVRAVVAPAQNRIISVERLAPTDAPFTREDAQEALNLAKGNAAVRRIVGDALDRYQLLESGEDAPGPLVAQVLPTRSTAPNDPCRVGRCVGVIFRNETGYLALSVNVDLTRRNVQVFESRRQHQ